jgi:hypothetical protein
LLRNYQDGTRNDRISKPANSREGNSKLPCVLQHATQALIDWVSHAQSIRGTLGAILRDSTVRGIGTTSHHGISKGKAEDAVSDANEELKGAFTIANLNDTDADDEIDNNDNDVIGTAVGAPAGTMAGKNERDLMKVVVDRPVNCSSCDVVVSIESGAAKWWTSSTKGQEFAVGNLTTISFSPTLTEQEFWLEATAASVSVRDIKVTASFGTATDTVKATGIWATQIAHTMGTPAQVAAIMGSQWDSTDMRYKAFAGFFTKMGGLGVIPAFDTQLTDLDIVAQNTILLEYTVTPTGIEDEDDVQWWVGQRKDVRRLVVGSTQTSAGFPNQADTSNDYIQGYNQISAKPVGGKFFIVDGPGHTKLLAGEERYYQGYFESFFKVDIGNNRPIRSDVGGRASDKLLWISKVHVEVDSNGVATRTEPDPNFTWNEIEIVPGSSFGPRTFEGPLSI